MSSRPRPPVEVLWCSRSPKSRENGWTFPRGVARHLQTLTAGRTVGQLFGGRASWGTRLDIDASTCPHVRGDAWMPPFRCDAFDVVILDPPYRTISQQMKSQLLYQAQFVAKDHVIWFHTVWIEPDSGLVLERGWLVRVGRMAQVRCIQVFRVASGEKSIPVPHYTRGPALRYNRWLDGQQGLFAS